MRILYRKGGNTTAPMSANIPFRIGTVYSSTYVRVSGTVYSKYLYMHAVYVSATLFLEQI